MADQESRVLNWLMKAYGLRQGQALPQYSALLGRAASNYSDPFSYYGTQYTEDRLQKIREYEAMDLSSSEVSIALNLYAEESSQESVEEKRSLWVTSENEETVQTLTDFFDSLDMENKLFGIARHLAKYGDMFIFPVAQATSGISDLIFPHPSLVRVAPDPNDYNKVIGYTCDALEIQQEGQLLSREMATKAQEGFTPWDFVHFRIPGSDLSSHYGFSMVESVRRTWKTLAMLETAVALYRITKGGSRLLFNVDVGQANAGEALRIINEYVRSLKTNTVLSVNDPAAGGNGNLEEFLQKYKPYGFLEDIFYPKAADADKAGVEVLQIPADIAAIEDVEHFKNKLRTGLAIPKAYFDGDISGWSANKALAQQDVQFARKMLRLQRAIIHGMNRLCQLHLLYRGEESFSFTLHMESPSALADMQRLEVFGQRLSAATQAIGAAEDFGFDKVKWAVKILTSIMGLSMDEIKEMMVRVPEGRQMPDFLGATQGAAGLFGGGAGAEGDGPPSNLSAQLTPLGGNAATAGATESDDDGGFERFLHEVEVETPPVVKERFDFNVKPKVVASKAKMFENPFVGRET